MAKKEETGLILWGSDADTNTPSFLRSEGSQGFDEVQPSRLASIYRLGQGLSDAVQEQRVKIGHFYEIQEQKDLGPERTIVIFKTRRVRQLSVNNGKTIACKSYRLDPKGFGTGRIRLFNKENIDAKYFEKWNLTQDIIDNNRVFDMPCAECFYGNWRTENGKSIGPECKMVYEVYFLDVTDVLSGGSLDKIPHRFEIVEANRPAREARQNLDELITKRLKIQGVPIWGGFFKMVSHRAENKEGQKFHVPRFEFLGLMTEEARPIFEAAKRYHDELVARQEELDEGEMRANREGEGHVSGDDGESSASSSNVQSTGMSTPWGDTVGDTGTEGAGGGSGSTPWA